MTSDSFSFGTSCESPDFRVIFSEETCRHAANSETGYLESLETIPRHLPQLGSWISAIQNFYGSEDSGEPQTDL